MYVSGVPGVDKTTLVHKVVRDRMLLSIDSDLPEFKHIFFKGIKVKKPGKSTCNFFK